MTRFAHAIRHPARPPPGRAHVTPGNRNRLRSSKQGASPGAAGQGHHPPRNRRARLRHSQKHRSHRHPCPPPRLDALRPPPRPARPPHRHRRPRQRNPQSQSPQRRSRYRSRRQAHHLLQHSRPRRYRRRSHLSQPGLPHLRIDDQLRRRAPRSHPPPGRKRLRPRRQRTLLPHLRSHKAHHPEFPPKSHRRRAHSARHPRHHPSHRRPQHHGPLRRDLQPPHLRRRALLHHVRPRLQRPHHPARRILQNLCHDRMAHGLRRDAPRSRRTHHSPHDQLQLLHRQFHADRRHRSHPWRPDFRRPHARRIPAPPRRLRRRPESHQRLLLPHAQRRVLRLSQRHQNRMDIKKTRRRPPRRRRHRLPLRHRLRRIRRGLPALQRSQLA